MSIYYLKIKYSIMTGFTRRWILSQGVSYLYIESRMMSVAFGAVLWNEGGNDAGAQEISRGICDGCPSTTLCRSRCEDFLCDGIG
jgi:hypothetical protein